MANEVQVPVGLDDKALINSIRNIEKNMDDLTKGIRSEFQETSKNVTSSLDKIGAGLIKNFAIGNIIGNLVGKGIEVLTGALKDAIDESVKFNRALLEIETILPKNTKLTKQLVAQLNDLSVQYGTSASQQAKAFYEIISAGVEDTTDATDLLTNANKLAVGGLADIAGTIDVLTSVYNVYGREIGNATEASDSLFKTVQLGKTTLQELQGDIGRVLPLARTFGVTLDEVGANLAILTNSGLKTREAVTFLNALFVAVARNGKELGTTMNSTAIQTDGLGVVLGRLIEKTGGSNDKLIKLLGTSEAVRAVQALAGQGLAKYNTTLGEYANKAGVAAEASKKIIAGDVGKQFEILGASISKSARSLIDVFTPALLNVLEIINGPTLKEKTLAEAFNVEGRLKNVRAELARLGIAYEQGKIKTSDFTNATAKLNEELQTLRVKDTEKQISTLTQQITALKTGFDFSGLGPLETTLEINKLEDKVKSLKAEIAKPLPPKLSVGAVDTGEDPDAKTIENRIKLNAEIKSLQEQFDLEEQNARTQRNLLLETDQFTARENEILNLYEFETQKINIATQAEIDKTSSIANEKDKKLAQDKIYADAELKLLQSYNKKELDSDKELARQKKLIDQAQLEATGNFISAGLVLAKDGSAVQKGLLITQAVINTYAGATRALADYPFPASSLVAGSVIALGLANVAKISGAKFEKGGIVGGSSTTGDKIPVRVNSREMILNQPQQAKLFAMANGESGGGNNEIMSAIMSLRNTPIVIQISGREIARAMRDESRSGFSFA